VPTETLAYEAALAEASERYRPAGRWAHGFARGKLGADPAYQRVLLHLGPQSTGLLVDLGCGEGHLLALVRAVAPGMELLGLDHDEGRVNTARLALAGEPGLTLATGDARQVDLPPADLICCIDLLHYFPPEDQDALLQRLVRALAPGGLLLIRDGRSDAGLRSTLTRWSEQLAVATGRHRGEGVFFRTAAELREVLEAAGLTVEVQPCSENTPFANMIWIGRRAQEDS
jgi:trans-aconitate methyltransferase